MSSTGEQLGWAATDQLGSATIQAVTIGPSGALLPSVPGFEYTGGAFGEGVWETEPLEIQVSTPLTLEVSFADTITAEGINALGVKAGHEDPEGNPSWEPGIEVELEVQGGSVDVASGFTDETGQFVALAQLAEGSESIAITVTITDEAGAMRTETVSATLVTTPSDGTGDLEIVWYEDCYFYRFEDLTRCSTEVLSSGIYEFEEDAWAPCAP